MLKSVFIPLTDELLYERPGSIKGPIVPFLQNARIPDKKLMASPTSHDTPRAQARRKQPRSLMSRLKE